MWDLIWGAEPTTKNWFDCILNGCGSWADWKWVNLREGGKLGGKNPLFPEMEKWGWSRWCKTSHGFGAVLWTSLAPENPKCRRSFIARSCLCSIPIPSMPPSITCHGVTLAGAALQRKLSLLAVIQRKSCLHCFQWMGSQCAAELGPHS